MRGSRRATGAPRREACEAPPIRHGLRRDTFPSGEGTGLVELGRGSPTVAPLRVGLRPPSWLREAATSCGGRRRLLRRLRPCTIAENRALSALSVHLHYPNPVRLTILRPARAAHRCRPAASGQRAQHPKPLQAAPARKQLALRNKRFRPSTQAARGPGAAMVLSRIGCHRAPFGSFPRVGKNTPLARATGKRSPRPSGAAKSPPTCAQRGRPPGAARPPSDNRHNTSSRSKPPPRGRS